MIKKRSISNDVFLLKPNPVKMLKKIADIKQEYAEIVKEAEAIKASQKVRLTSAAESKF